MGIIYIINKTKETVTVQDYFLINASYGYNGDTQYILSPDGHEHLDNSFFTQQTMNEMKPLVIHVLIDGKKRLVLNHRDFEVNKAMVFEMNDDELVVKVVPIEAERGFAGKLWYMLPSCGTDASTIDALVAAAKPRNSDA